MSPSYDPEDALLPLPSSSAADEADTHALRTAPIITSDALHHLGPGVIPQRAVYGRLLAQHAPGFPSQSVAERKGKGGTGKVYVNTNAPFSALVCGVQGSGKSHSTSVLLESCLVKDERIGTLPEPLSALVFHFDTAAGGGLVQPCEAAYLAALDPSRAANARAPPVKVLVLPNSITNMRRVYAGLPGVTVESLHFAPGDINGSRLLSMMKLADGQQLPLYMEALMDILRSMETNFSYTAFRAELAKQKFSPAQKSMLNLRLALLDSCLAGGNVGNSVSRHFVEGQLTIIDLSSPFMDPTSACGFFDLILGLFIEAPCTSGKIVVLDEAHKYLSESSSRLTESLLTVIRQQRHLATRVVVSTQEPTVVPEKYLDLCSFVIAHRFSSPVWLKTLAGHVSAERDNVDDLFAKIVALRTGEGILFAASGLGLKEDEFGAGEVTPLGRGYVLVKSRLRITRDGGHSLLAVQADEAPVPAMTSHLPSAGAGSGAQTSPKQPESTLPAGIRTPPKSPPRKQSTAGQPDIQSASPKPVTPQQPSSQSVYAQPNMSTSTQATTNTNGPPPPSSSEPSRKRADISSCNDVNVTHLVSYLEEQERGGVADYISFKKARAGISARGAVIAKNNRGIFERAERMGFVETKANAEGKNYVRLLAKQT
ncbi:hypothetical protein PENSPDRAFT_680683 [Peniophora sp. CONT]|nr:hypothetical protein PENSPDRAFT_680683 [Peniophora sp. CONT]